MIQLLKTVTIEYNNRAVYELQKKCLIEKSETVFSFDDKNMNISIDCSNLDRFASMCSTIQVLHTKYKKLCTIDALHKLKDNG
jgi:hypothetical protein